MSVSPNRFHPSPASVSLRSAPRAFFHVFNFLFRSIQFFLGFHWCVSLHLYIYPFSRPPRLRLPQSGWFCFLSAISSDRPVCIQNRFPEGWSCRSASGSPQRSWRPQSGSRHTFQPQCFHAHAQDWPSMRRWSSAFPVLPARKLPAICPFLHLSNRKAPSFNGATVAFSFGFHLSGLRFHCKTPPESSTKQCTPEHPSASSLWRTHVLPVSIYKYTVFFQFSQE